ncbi:unnamed protein product [Leuciscus chuanchicus]
MSDGVDLGSLRGAGWKASVVSLVDTLRWCCMYTGYSGQMAGDRRRMTEDRKRMIGDKALTRNLPGREQQLREPVGAALTSIKTDVTPPTALEYEAVQDALDILAPFRQDTVELSGDKRVSASKKKQLIYKLKQEDHFSMSFCMKMKVFRQKSSG